MTIQQMCMGFKLAGWEPNLDHVKKRQDGPVLMMEPKTSGEFR